MTYLDIETVSAFPTFADADARTQELFATKFKHDQSFLEVCKQVFLRDGVVGDAGLLTAYNLWYQEKAGLYAEFNKIVCVSFGWVVTEGGPFNGGDLLNPKREEPRIELKSFYQLDEKALLLAVAGFMKDKYQFCAHFGKGFDYRVLSQKFIIYGLPLPACLDNAGKKPWEIGLVDTAEMWKFGDMKHTCSLDLLAHCFGLPSPKQDMHGADVGRVYHTEGIEGLKKIVAYCEADVKALVNVHRRITGQTMILTNA